MNKPMRNLETGEVMPTWLMASLSKDASLTDEMIAKIVDFYERDDNYRNRRAWFDSLHVLLKSKGASEGGDIREDLKLLTPEEVDKIYQEMIWKDAEKKQAAPTVPTFNVGDSCAVYGETGEVVDVAGTDAEGVQWYRVRTQTGEKDVPATQMTKTGKKLSRAEKRADMRKNAEINTGNVEQAKKDLEEYLVSALGLVEEFVRFNPSSFEVANLRNSVEQAIRQTKALPSTPVEGSKKTADEPIKSGDRVRGKTSGQEAEVVEGPRPYGPGPMLVRVMFDDGVVEDVRVDQLEKISSKKTADDLPMGQTEELRAGDTVQCNETGERYIIEALPSRGGGPLYLRGEDGIQWETLPSAVTKISSKEVTKE